MGYKIKTSNNISGVVLSDLKQFDDENGRVFHAIKNSDPEFEGFGEAYFSFVNKNKIKGWKKHKKMTLNIVVPIGEILFVIYDDRPNSDTYSTFQEVKLSPKNYKRLTVPDNLWMGFMGLGEHTNALLNVANLKHNPSESENLPLDGLSYNWKSLKV